MGYTIVYARTFIKTTKGIIPLVLHGSNNCTEFVNGREVRERSWDIYHDKLCELPEDKFMETVHSMFAHLNPDDLLFKWNNKWLCAGQIEQWFKRGVRDARSIEDILHDNPRVCVRGKVVVNNSDYSERKVLHDRFFNTTNELEEWIARASGEVGKQSSEGNHAYLHIGFTTRHSLAYHPYISEPVVAKMVDGYISNVNETELQCTRTATGAMVFASTKEAEEKIGAWAKHYNVQYVKYSTVCTPKPFAIQVAGGSRAGYFIAKRTARRIFFTPNAENARRFPTRQRAIAAIQDLLAVTDSIGPLTVFEIK